MATVGALGRPDASGEEDVGQKGFWGRNNDTYGEMDSITRRQPSMSQDNLLGTLGGGPRNVKHLIDDPEQSVECRLDGVPAVDGDVPMQDLLQDLGVGDEALAVIDQLFEPSLRVALVGVRRAHEIHGDV